MYTIEELQRMLDDDTMIGGYVESSMALQLASQLLDTMRENANLQARITELETFDSPVTLVEHAQMKARIEEAMRIEPPTVDGILINRDYALGHRAALSKVRAALEVE